MTETEELSRAEILARLAAAREENANLTRQKAVRESYGINFYIPHEKQHKFHISGATGRYMRFGNRGGKSECGIVEDENMCLGERPFYKNAFDVLNGKREVVFHHPGGANHPFVTTGIPQRPVKGLIIVVDWEMSERIFFNRTGAYETLGKFFKFIPRESLGRIKTDGKSRVVQVEIKRPRERGGGSSTLTIDTVFSYKTAKLTAESADWDFIHVDEPCPEAMFKAHARGLMDRAGRYWFNCTPLDEMWINDEFTPPKAKVGVDAPDGIAFEKTSSNPKHKPTRFIITGSIFDNPHRTEEGVAEFESTLTSAEKECRLFGIPTAMAGLVYKEFEYDTHVLQEPPRGWVDPFGQPSFSQPPENYTIRWWWDYHTRLPQAVLFFATAPDGTIFVYDELFTENLIAPVARQVLAREAGRFVADREIDSLALQPHPVTNESVVDELAKYEIYVNPATKDLRVGINKVRQRLLERDHRGRPSIYFSPNLTQTLFEFNHYVYDLDKNEPKDKDNHMMEDLYRGLYHGCPYISPPIDGSESYRRKPATVSHNEDRKMTFGKLPLK